MPEGITQPEQLLKTYQTEADILKKQQAALAEKQAGAATFGGELRRRIGAREISPEARAREREVIAEMFGMPTEIEARMREAGVAPTEAGAMIADRMNQYLGQLSSLRESRRARRDRIDDIIKEAAAGVKAEAALFEASVEAQEGVTNRAWQEYKEAVRQQEFAIVQARLARQAAALSALQKKINIQDKISDYFRYEVRPGEDGAYSVKDYLKGREFSRVGGKVGDEVYTGLGSYDWFDRTHPVEGWINLANPENVSQLAEANINVGNTIRSWNNERRVAEFADVIERARITNDPGLISGTHHLYEDSGIDMNDADMDSVGGKIADMVKEFDDLYGTDIYGNLW